MVLRRPTHHHRYGGATSRRSMLDYISRSPNSPRDPRQTSLFGQLAFGGLTLATLTAGGGPLNSSASDALVLILVFFAVLPMLAIRGLSPELRNVGKPLILAVAALATWQLLLAAILGGDLVGVVKDTMSVVYALLAAALLLPNLASGGPRVGTRLLVLAALMLSAITLLEGGGSRASGTFSNPNLTGAWLGAAFLVILLSGFPRRVSIRALVLLPILLALLATGSFAAISALAIAFVFWCSRRWQFSRLQSLLSLTAGVGLSYLLILWVDTLGGASRVDRSFNSRNVRWSLGWEEWLSNPLGIGPGNYAANTSSALGRTEIHSDYLQALVETGLVGLGLLLLVGIVIWRVGSVATQTVLIFSAWVALWRDAQKLPLPVALHRGCDRH